LTMMNSSRILREGRFYGIHRGCKTEHYVNVTRKISTPVAAGTARQVISAYSAWVRAPNTAQTVLRASEISETSHISFWDAMIVASAEDCDAPILWSEDLNAGQSIAGIRIVNPLK
jgi:predicted nucleic acid-binding protein